MQTCLERTLQMWVEGEKPAAERRSSSFGPFLRSLLHTLAVRSRAGELTVSRHRWCSAATQAASRQLSDCWLSVLLRQGVWGGEWVRMNEERVPISPRSLDLPARNTGEVMVYTLQRALETLSSALRDTVRTCAVPKSNSTPLSNEWERFQTTLVSLFSTVLHTEAPKSIWTLKTHLKMYECCGVA